MYTSPAAAEMAIALVEHIIKTRNKVEDTLDFAKDFPGELKKSLQEPPTECQEIALSFNQ